MSSKPFELTSFISPDSFLHLPSSLSPADPRDNVVLFFIPGNPGLVSYYHTFLSLLSDPKTSPTTSRCIVAGLSLGGFEVSASDGDAVWQRAILHPENAPEGPLYSLREQIELTTRRLETLVGLLQRQRDSEARLSDYDPVKPCKVVLIGHSVGAYIALEVLQSHRARYPSPLVDHVSGCGEVLDITAAILLTPTILDIALSSNGKVLAPTLKYIPWFPLFASLAAQCVTKVLPTSWLAKLVKAVMGRHTLDEAVGSTISFLRSRNGVRQSLGMAADEMRDIGEDVWGEEIWGVSDTGKKDFDEDGWTKVNNSSELVFYFANQDHWVADQTREQIISTRGGKEGIGRPRMIVAEVDELVHGWCISHSRLVGHKVHHWVEEILERR